MLHKLSFLSMYPCKTLTNVSEWFKNNMEALDPDHRFKKIYLFTHRPSIKNNFTSLYPDHRLN